MVLNKLRSCLMCKRYLVFAGDNYYPQRAWDDFKGSFDTKDEAKEFALSLKEDWYQIIDLEKEI